jgi:hypothetical protein
MGAAPLFLDPETPLQQRRNVGERLAKRHPEAFATPDHALAHLHRIHLPATLDWAFLNNSKAGTSSARRFLFRLHFGVPLTTAWHVPNDINTDSVVQNLQGPAGLWRQSGALPAPLRTLDAALRLTTVRHPVSRAVSAFAYICAANDQAHSRFVMDRLRMNVVVRFDWTSDPRTADGFCKFLDYVAWCQETIHPADINPHWRPQIDNVLPQVFRPDIVGRLEDLPAFYRDVAARLDKPLPDGFAHPASNRQTYSKGRDVLTDAAMERIRHIYARDFAWLGYPEDIAR